MISKQIKLLKILAKKIRTEKKDSVKVVASLQSAKILTKKGDFTTQYNLLNEIFSISK